MYIKEIKTNGFKSFVDRTTLTLNSTFTGIVGPNGSGKSNIVDAIKWVLGEQSVKTLRGSNAMTDVIFTGSKTRKPSSSASVTIIFDNSDKHLPVDYNEVSIKRVVYKSGENEYFLNNSRCRLKDITDLFVDSFSSKESFNIISQGKVSEILSNKAEDRRSILEEAAGVLKYKNRKKESLRKLARTNENIARIDMIINELNESVEPLKAQAEVASLYKKAKENLSSLEISLAVLDIVRNNEVYKNNENRIKEINESLISESKVTSRDETTLEKLKLEQITLDEEVNKIQKELIESNNMLSKISEQKELTRERSKYSSTDIKVKNNLIDIKEKKLKLNTEVNVLDDETVSLKSELSNISEIIDDLIKESNSLDDKKRKLQYEYNTENKKYLELKYKKDLLENSIQNSSKVPYGVKSVLENPKLNGIINTIGNIIDTEEKYHEAIETALAGALNFVIVKDENAAKEAINYLKRNKIGRVTFFPLNIIKPKSIDPNMLEIVREDEGFISIASDLVTYDKEFYNIITNQLGNIIVAKDINSALRISKKINHRYKIVSLDSELIHVGGSLTGGSRKNNISAMGDKFELSRISNLLSYSLKDIKEKEETIHKLDSKIESIKENIFKKTSLKIKYNEEYNLKLKNKTELSNELSRISDELDNLTKNSGEELEQEFNKIMEEFYKEEQIKKGLENKLNSCINKRSEVKETITETEEVIRKQNSNYNRLSNELKALEIENVKVGMILDNSLELLNENYNLTFNNAKENYNLEVPEDEARERLKELKNEIKGYGEVNLGSIEEYERVSKRYNFLLNEKEDLVKSEENLLEIINEMDNTMEEKFIDTFNKVNIEFKKVFNNLFGGGEAKLELTDPSNILETGIDIKAIPPGKKLTNISLLSGGEKTLTAISLLFAIMNLNNVPFAILDEVEAALDEANVERFGSYLDNYRNKTQLLIITHKKKTMEYVDLLYGITMQESGVSKVVSVKLENIE